MGRWTKEAKRWWLDAQHAVWRKGAAFVALGIIPSLVMMGVMFHAVAIWPPHYQAAARSVQDSQALLNTGICDTGNTEARCGYHRANVNTSVLAKTLRLVLSEVSQDFSIFYWTGCTADSVCMHYLHRLLEFLLSSMWIVLMVVVAYLALMLWGWHQTRQAYALMQILYAQQHLPPPHAHTQHVIKM